MYLTFKAFMMKEWRLIDDSIFVKEKEYKLSDITKVTHTPSTGAGVYGVIQFFHPSATLGFVTLSYPRKQMEDGEKAARYIIAAVQGKSPNKAMEQRENGYQKYCNFCGHIFCYTQEDIQRNKEIADYANRTATIGIFNALAGNSAATAVNSHSAIDQLNRIVDYSKCPKCGSKDLRDATDEDIENSKNPQAQVVQQFSPADELKKYKELLDLGIISQEEFDAKKKQLLGL